MKREKKDVELELEKAKETEMRVAELSKENQTSKEQFQKAEAII